MSRNLVIGFSEPASPIMEGIIDLHNYISIYLILILVLVLWIFFSIIYRFGYLIRRPFTAPVAWTYRIDTYRGRKFSHHPLLEIFWTVAPSIILILIAIPSFILLYQMDEILSPRFTFKVIGNQWYWSYEHSNDSGDNEFPAFNFDSNIVFEADLHMGEYRLLECDNPLVLPTNIQFRVIITSLDVIHSWSVPSLGIKGDAVPGRLNQIPLLINRQGVFYGMCSELCGVNHGFMPIMVKATSLEHITKIQENASSVSIFLDQNLNNNPHNP